MFRQCDFFVWAICAKVRLWPFPSHQTLLTGFSRTVFAFLPLGVRDPRELEFRRDRPLPFPDPELFAISTNLTLLSQ
jgi:hypothetical protein